MHLQLRRRGHHAHTNQISDTRSRTLTLPPSCAKKYLLDHAPDACRCRPLILAFPLSLLPVYGSSPFGHIAGQNGPRSSFIAYSVVPNLASAVRASPAPTRSHPTRARSQDSFDPDLSSVLGDLYAHATRSQANYMEGRRHLDNTGAPFPLRRCSSPLKLDLSVTATIITVHGGL